MPLAPPVSRPAHVARPPDERVSSKQRPSATTPSSELSRRGLVIASLIAGLLLIVSAAGGVSNVRRRLRAKPQQLVIYTVAGDTALNCTASRGAVGRTCLAAHLRHTAAATNATRAATGKAGALAAAVLGVSTRLPDPVAVTFYDDPVRLLGETSWGSSADQSCPDITPADAAPTVFAARDNPSLYHLLRVQLLPIFLALASFGLQDGAFQLVLTDGRPRDWASYVFDEAGGHPAQLLQGLPPCFSARHAVLGVRYDTFRISAHKAASAADTVSARPQLVAFAAWLLRRFGARHAAKPELFGTGTHASTSVSAAATAAATAADPAATAGMPEPAAPAKAAYEQPTDSTACKRVQALPQSPPFTIVLRTGKRNGNGRRLTGVEHLTHAAEACGFAVTQLDMAALPFAQQLQAVANSSVLFGVHGAAMTLLLALPPWGVSVELLPYKFDESVLYYHVHGNWAAAAARTHLVWHNTNPWHASAGVARVDDYKNHDVRMVPGEAERIVAAAAAALAVPLQQRNLDSPVVLNEAVRRCSYQHVMGNLQDDCAVQARSGRT